MNSRGNHSRKHLATAMLAVSMVLIVPAFALAGNELAGRWTLTINIPESANSTNTRTLIVNLDVIPRGDSLHGRATMTDQAGRTVGAAWRQVCKTVSNAFELTFPVSRTFA